MKDSHIYAIAPSKRKAPEVSITQDIIDRSRAAGFNAGWPIFSDYAIIGGVLKEQGTIRRLIAPAGISAEILAALEKVHTGQIQPLDFCRSYGLLGFTHVCPPEERERYQGDPLVWFKKCASDVFCVLRLLDAIRQKDIHLIREMLEQSPALLFSSSWPSQPVRAAQELVKVLVDPYLKGIRRELEVGPEKIQSVFHPDALVNVVFWELANAADDVTLIRRCGECGKLFIGTDARQQYCNATCSGRHRIKKFRSKPKQRRKKKP